MAALTKVVAHMKEPLWLWRLKMTQASMALMEGRYDEARTLADEALIIGRRGGHQGADFLALVFSDHLSAQTGDGQQEVEQGVRAFTEQRPIMTRAWLMNVLVEFGRIDEAAELWRSIVVPHIDAIPRRIPEWILARSAFADVCALLGDTAVAPKIYADLLPSPTSRWPPAVHPLSWAGRSLSGETGPSVGRARHRRSPPDQRPAPCRRDGIAPVGGVQPP